MDNVSIAPKTPLSNLLHLTKTLYDKFDDEETDSKLIASELGYDQRTTGFYRKLNDLKSYGLFESIGRKIKITALGKQAILGDDKEKQKALNETIHNIGLWDILLNEYEGNIKKGDFLKYLAQISGVESSDIKTKTVELYWKAFLDIFQYFELSNEDTKSQELQKGEERPIEGISKSPKEEEPEKPFIHIKYPGLEIKIEDVPPEHVQKILEPLISVISGRAKQQKQTHLWNEEQKP